MNESFKRFQRSIGRNALICTRALIKRIPYPVFRFLSRVFILIGRPLLNKKRRLAMENLQTAFGSEKTQEEMRDIANACFDNFGRGMIDLIYFIDRPSEIANRVRIAGKEHLDKAFEEGNGAILVSAHFGNFILMYLRMVEEGYKTNVIMRRTRDKAFENYISDFRNEQGLKTIYDLPPRQCVQKSLKALRKNEILIILLDQNYGGDGRVFVDFFGNKAATATGPVIFSTRTNAPILPVFISRDEDGGLDHTVTIDPPIELVAADQGQDFVVTNVARITKVIEQKVRQYPHEWGGWMHQRWKSKTKEEQAVIDRHKEERKQGSFANNK